MDEYLQLGIGAAFALLVLDRVIQIVKVARMKEVAVPVSGSGSFSPKHSDELFRIGRATNALYEIHLGSRAIDKNGDPKWYTTSELQTERHGEVVTLLKELVEVNREIAKELKKEER